MTTRDQSSINTMNTTRMNRRNNWWRRPDDRWPATSTRFTGANRLLLGAAYNSHAGLPSTMAWRSRRAGGRSALPAR